MLDRSKNPNLINSVFSLLLAKMVQLHFLQSIFLAIRNPLNFVDIGVSSIAYTQ